MKPSVLRIDSVLCLVAILFASGCSQDRAAPPPAAPDSRIETTADVPPDALASPVSGAVSEIDAADSVGMPDWEAAAQRVYKIAILPGENEGARATGLRVGAMKAARALVPMANVEVLWYPPDEEGAPEAQRAVFEDLVRQAAEGTGPLAEGAGGIVLAPLDAAVMHHAVEEARRSGLAVVVVGRVPEGIDAGTDGESPYFVEPNDWEGGRWAGRFLSETLQGQGRIALLGAPGASDAPEPAGESAESLARRQRGFSHAVREAKGIELVELETPKAALEATGQTEGFDAVYCLTEGATLSLFEALDASDAPRGFDEQRLRVIGYGRAPAMIDALSKGEILDGLIIDDTVDAGERAARTLVEDFLQRRGPKRVDSDTIMMTFENIVLDNVQDVLAPDPARWQQE